MCTLDKKNASQSSAREELRVNLIYSVRIAQVFFVCRATKKHDCGDFFQMSVNTSVLDVAELDFLNAQIKVYHRKFEEQDQELISFRETNAPPHILNSMRCVMKYFADEYRALSGKEMETCAPNFLSRFVAVDSVNSNVKLCVSPVLEKDIQSLLLGRIRTLTFVLDGEMMVARVDRHQLDDGLPRICVTSEESAKTFVIRQSRFVFQEDAQDSRGSFCSFSNSMNIPPLDPSMTNLQAYIMNDPQLQTLILLSLNLDSSKVLVQSVLMIDPESFTRWQQHMESLDLPKHTFHLQGKDHYILSVSVEPSNGSQGKHTMCIGWCVLQSRV